MKAKGVYLELFYRKIAPSYQKTDNDFLFIRPISHFVSNDSTLFNIKSKTDAPQIL